MSDESKSSISIGSVSGVSGNFAVGGDAVGGDKIVGNKIVGGDSVGRDQIMAGDAAIQQVMGFATPAAQQQFIAEIDNLRKVIVETKGQIELQAGEQQEAQQLLGELSELVKSLRDAQQQAKELPVGEPAPPKVADTLNGYLTAAEKLVEKAQAFGEKVTQLALKVAPIALPLLKSIRMLLRM